VLAKIAGAGTSAKQKDRELASVLARLAALEATVRAGADPDEAARESIVRALATAVDGKPGFLSMADLEKKCEMTKSAVHHHTNELEKKGRVWIRKTHDAKTGRPCFLVYHPSAVRA